MNRASRLASSCVLLASTVLAASLTSGCAAVGVIASAVTPPPLIEARFEPAKVTTLVLVDPAPRVADAASVSMDADRLARMLGKALAERQVVPTVVENEKLAVVRDSQIDATKKLSVTEIARKLGAEQVIFVELDPVGIGVAQGSDAMKGVASARVRVVDVRAAQVTYPTGDVLGEAVAYETDIRRMSDEVTAASVRADTLQGLADRIAKLFYSYRADEGQKTMMR